MIKEWETEPNRLEFKHLGFDCLIVRNEHGGHLCGYVGVPGNHAWHKQHYDNVLANVHGGLTYSDSRPGAPGAPDDIWWLGFDCAHYGDSMPKFSINAGGRIYRNIAYVKGECERLAEQAKVAAQ